jgi:hypothetical protein
MVSWPVGGAAALNPGLGDGPTLADGDAAGETAGTGDGETGDGETLAGAAGLLGAVGGGAAVGAAGAAGWQASAKTAKQSSGRISAARWWTTMRPVY